MSAPPRKVHTSYADRLTAKAGYSMAVGALRRFLAGRHGGESADHFRRRRRGYAIRRDHDPSDVVLVIAEAAAREPDRFGKIDGNIALRSRGTAR